MESRVVPTTTTSDPGCFSTHEGTGRSQAIVMSACRQIRQASKQMIKKNEQCRSHPLMGMPQANSNSTWALASQGGYRWQFANGGKDMLQRRARAQGLGQAWHVALDFGNGVSDVSSALLVKFASQGEGSDCGAPHDRRDFLVLDVDAAQPLPDDVDPRQRRLHCLTDAAPVATDDNRNIFHAAACASNAGDAFVSDVVVVQPQQSDSSTEGIVA